MWRTQAISASDSDSKTGSLDYKQAGVDIDAGNALVQDIGPLVKSTNRTGVMGGIGGFGGFFDPKAAGFEDPILVAATDGVGTKLKVALEAGIHNTVGIDLVAMCVNDLVVQGAEPLFFLDYYATGHLDRQVARDVIAGIAEGCTQSGCALIGGETAEMPGMYGDGDYDLAGFSVGAVERDQVLTGEDVSAGDTILGLASTGVHSNGFSLVRKIAERAGLTFADAAPFAPETTLGHTLLTPTKLYVKSCLTALRKGQIKALAHITGGGLPENLPRVLPDGLGCKIDASMWACPPVFQWLQQAGDVPSADMFRTFNCGIGMAVITSDPNACRKTLEDAGETVFIIGTVVDDTGSGEVLIGGEDAFWPG